MRDAADRGWRGVVAHFRGCSGEAEPAAARLPLGRLRRGRLDPAAGACTAGRWRHSTQSASRSAATCWPNGSASAPRMRSFVTAAASIGSPLDLAAGGAALARGFNRIYTQMFLATLKPKALAKLERFPGVAHVERLRAQPQSVRIRQRLHGAGARLPQYRGLLESRIGQAVARRRARAAPRAQRAERSVRPGRRACRTVRCFALRKARAAGRRWTHRFRARVTARAARLPAAATARVLHARRELCAGIRGRSIVEFPVASPIVRQSRSQSIRRTPTLPMLLPMDDSVIAAIAKWPNVPAVFGWLALTRAGNGACGASRSAMQRSASSSAATTLATSADAGTSRMDRSGSTSRWKLAPWIWRTGLDTAGPSHDAHRDVAPKRCTGGALARQLGSCSYCDSDLGFDIVIRARYQRACEAMRRLDS